MSFPEQTLTMAERAQDQAKRDAALKRLASCRTVVDRMTRDLTVSARKQAKWVPTQAFDEALYWAELQLARARYVQQRYV